MVFIMNTGLKKLPHDHGPNFWVAQLDDERGKLLVRLRVKHRRQSNSQHRPGFPWEQNLHDGAGRGTYSVNSSMHCLNRLRLPVVRKNSIQQF